MYLKVYSNEQSSDLAPGAQICTYPHQNQSIGELLSSSALKLIITDVDIPN